MAQRRVVITGMGAVSSIGTGLEGVAASLREGRSGLTRVEEWAELGIGSQVAGLPEAEPESPLRSRRTAKTSSSTSLMALRATAEALDRAAIPYDSLRGKPVPVLIGSGTGSLVETYRIGSTIQSTHSTRRVSPFGVPQVMGSTAAANVSVALGTRGESWSISSACSTGSHALGLALLLVRMGRYDQVIVGAAEEVDWSRAGAFDAMRALSRGFNHQPACASRPFDRRRDGFVISGGAGVLVIEELEAARRRGAPIAAELVGYGANSDGRDMVAPDPEGAAAVLGLALEDAGLAPEEIDYVNAHGTSTPQGDPSEAKGMATVFGARQPWISSTKSTTGHALGAAGSLEAIYTTLMLQQSFLAPSVNLDDVDPACEHLRLVRNPNNSTEARTAISTSFGFGGTNACLVLRRWEERAVA